MKPSKYVSTISSVPKFKPSTKPSKLASITVKLTQIFEGISGVQKKQLFLRCINHLQSFQQNKYLAFSMQPRAIIQILTQTIGIPEMDSFSLLDACHDEKFTSTSYYSDEIIFLLRELKYTKSEVFELMRSPFVDQVGELSTLDFTRLDLRGLNFSSLDLHNSDFSGSNLQGANFFKAILNRSRFSPIAYNIHSTEIHKLRLDSNEYWSVFETKYKKVPEKFTQIPVLLSYAIFDCAEMNDVFLNEAFCFETSFKETQLKMANFIDCAISEDQIINAKLFQTRITIENNKICILSNEENKFIRNEFSRYSPEFDTK